MTEEMSPEENAARDALSAVAEGMARKFATLPPEEVESRLVETFAVLRRQLGEANARVIFKGFAESFDLHQKQNGGE